jgi:AMP-binding enzyme
VAAALATRGIGPGDRVALSCPNLPYFPVVYYGILKAGATVVPLNILLTEREIAYHLGDSAARAYFCFEGTAELPVGQAGRAAFEATESCEHFILLSADPDPATVTSPIPATGTLAEFTQGQPTTFSSAATSETDTAVILYTSGTTGQPKGAELTHSNMVHNVLLANRLFGLHPHDVHLTVLPLFHSFGQTVQLNAGFATGATVLLMPRFDAGQALELMQAERVTFFAGVHPGRLQRLSARAGRGPADPPGGEPGRGRRRAAPQPRRGGQGVRGPHPRRGDHRSGPRRLVPGEHGGLQVPADRGVPRQPAHDRHRQDPQAGTRPAARARGGPVISVTTEAGLAARVRRRNQTTVPTRLFSRTGRGSCAGRGILNTVVLAGENGGTAR